MTISNQQKDELAVLMLRKNANKCTSVNADVTMLCEAALSAAELIESKYVILLPKEMWGETHEERYCKSCGFNSVITNLTLLLKK